MIDRKNLLFLISISFLIFGSKWFSSYYLYTESISTRIIFESVTDVLLQKTFKAAEEYGLRNISVSGGLAASRKLRKAFEEESYRRGIKLYWP